MPAPTAERGAATPLLYLAFFLSGAAALAYEAVWTRYLGLLVGHDAHAQVLVLVIFLGGMSLGAIFVARRSRAIGRPLLAYAAVEAVVGLLALAFPAVFAAASRLAYDGLFPALADGPMLAPVKWLLAALLILPQSVLLGTTFPLMSAGVIRLGASQPGRILAWLYFTNSLGGATGVLLAGFVLIGMAGLPGTLAAAGALNLVVALLTVVAARTRGDAVVVAAAPEAPKPVTESVPPRLLLGVAFGTAVASFAYEIDWIRMLSLVLGSATHSFELMLSAFILGLAIGAFLIRRLDGLAAPLAVLGAVQVAMGVAAVATLPVYVASFGWMTALLDTFARTESGYAGFSLARYAICLAVMLPSTICAGMTLPLITRALMASGEGEAAIGRVYAWNTLGSIVGVALAALVLLPWLGLKVMLVAAGALDIALGIAIFIALGRTRRAAAAAAAAVVAVVTLSAAAPLRHEVVTSGVYRRGAANRVVSALPYYADGRTATVSVAAGPDGTRWIATNGKPDASLGPWWQAPCTAGTRRRPLGGDEITQVLLGAIARAYAPAAPRVAMIGLGSGVSSHVLLADPGIAELTTIEIEPAMVAGAREFLPANARVYDDPRSRIVLRDAKAHFAASGEPWGLIISEPSNPWVSGVAGLFTEEFYRRVHAALTPDGILGQWIHTYELDDGLVLSVLAAIDRVFPAWRLHQVGSGDLLVIATPAAALPAMDPAPLLESPGFRADLCRFHPIQGDDLRHTILAEAALLRPVLRRIGQPNSDDYPVLDLGAERARYVQATASGLLALGYDWFNLARALEGAAPVVVTPGSPLALREVTLLRESWIRTVVDGGDDPDSLATAARGVVRTWAALAAAPIAPVQWGGWLAAERSAALVRHAGMAGVADSSHYAEAIASAGRLAAPAAVADVLRFRRAVQAWDAPTALDAAVALYRAGAAGTLIPADELRDGAVVMALRGGQLAMAREWLGVPLPGSGRGVGDLRNLLLAGRAAQDLLDQAP